MNKKSVLGYYENLMVNVYRQYYKGYYTAEQSQLIINDFINNLVSFVGLDEDITKEDINTISSNAIQLVKEELSISDDEEAKQEEIKKELYLLHSKAVSQYDFAFNSISGSGYFPVDPMMYGKHSKQKTMNRIKRLENFIQVKEMLKTIYSEFCSNARKNVKYLNNKDRKAVLNWKNEIIKLMAECDIFISQYKEMAK